jgi:hypothetical protein
MACLLVAYPLLTFSLVDKVPHDVGEVFFKVPTVHVQGAAEGARPAILRNLRGDLSLTAPTAADQQFQWRTAVLKVMVELAVAFLVCHWMWRLCRHVENGDIFTPTNLMLVRRLGALLIIDALVGFGLGVWTANQLSQYIYDRVSFPGLELVPPSYSILVHARTAGLEINQIITGLLVLCLVEVFRQGLKLKHEADLTV